tara:strand:- start:712 stop:891 length:180 start_codon:yes stop_codon:yes gene_type:complete
LVQKFTSDHLLLPGWGSGGSEGGQFQNPTVIAIDREGNVYVSESGGQTGLNRWKKPGMM